MPLFLRDFLFLTFLPNFFPLLPPAISQSLPCSSTGVWGDWGQWSPCPSPPSPMPYLNVRRRIRPCSPQPPGCVPSAPYNCSGPYSDENPCESGGLINSGGGNGGWNAQMLQSMNLNRQYPPSGSSPGGSSATFSAGMLQSMQINDTTAGRKRK